MNWPDSPQAGMLGDGRFASSRDRPESVDALRQAVTDRVGQGWALYPQGGGTALDYGGIPRAPGVVIDSRGLDRVIDYPAADMTITVEAGITMAALGAVLAEKQQRLLIDVPQTDRATLGGVYATNTSGPRRYGAGRPRDQILGVSFVTSDGALVKGGGRVVKNVAGYDFPRLLTGSMGTLGILVQLTLKVRPIPEASALAWATFARPDELAGLLERLNTSATRPIAIELLNAGATRLAGRPVEKGWALAIGFEDNAASVAWQVDRLRSELGPTGVSVLEGADAEPLWSALIAFPALDSPEIGPLSFTASVKLSSVVPFVKEFDPARWAVQAHAGNGIIRGHALGEVDRDRLGPELDRLRALANRDSGSLVLARCPTSWKESLGVWGVPRPDWALAERVKRTLDPRGVMNPGRFVGTI